MTFLGGCDILSLMENNKEITIGKDIEEIKESFFHTLVPVAFSTYLSLMQDKDNPALNLNK